MFKLECQNLLQHCSLFFKFKQNYFDHPTKLFSELQNRSFRVHLKTKKSKTEIKNLTKKTTR